MSSQYKQLPQAGGAPSGAAGGDLSGTYPNPTLNQTTTGIDGPDRQLFDKNNIVSIDYDQRGLLDPTGLTTLNYQLRVLNDSSENTSLDWEAGELITPGGGQIAVDWLNLHLIATSGNTAIDWGNYLTNDNSGIVSIDFSNRLLKNSSSATVLNWNTAVLIPTTEGQVNLASASGSQGNSSFVTVSFDGLYSISFMLSCAVGGSTATVSTQLKWTDTTSTAQTVNPLPSATIVLATVGTTLQSTYVVEAKAGTTIVYNTTVTGTVGTGRYNYRISAVKVQ